MVRASDVKGLVVDFPKRCDHEWEENFDIGGIFCVHCGGAFEENKKDVYDYVVSIIKKYQPHAARIMINAYCYRDTEMVDMVRTQGEKTLKLDREKTTMVIRKFKYMLSMDQCEEFSNALNAQLKDLLVAE